MNEIQQVIGSMDPSKAMAELAEAVKETLRHLDVEKRREYLLTMIGESGGDKVASMVDL